MNKDQIIAKAEMFCKENNVNDYPVNIVSLCEQFGFKVFGVDLPKEVSGFIVVQDEPFKNFETNMVIGVNKNESARRRRFTIAHELAHFCLHRNENEQLYAHRDTDMKVGSIEWEANLFASNILMPKKLVKQSIESLKESSLAQSIPREIVVRHIAENFLVSESAADVRLDQLGVFWNS